MQAHIFMEKYDLRLNKEGFSILEYVCSSALGKITPENTSLL